MKNFVEYEPQDLISEIEKKFGAEYMNKILTGEVRIVITGGEPSLCRAAYPDARHDRQDGSQLSDNDSEASSEQAQPADLRSGNEWNYLQRITGVLSALLVRQLLSKAFLFWNG